MKVYVVRHAQAEDSEVDADRRLTREGRKEARRLGKELRAHDIRPDTIWHSGLARALETAEEIAAQLRGKPAVKKQNGLKPSDAPSKIAKVLAKTNDDVMVVGHEPFLGRLTAQLVLSQPSAPLVRLRKPSAVCLERLDHDAWRIVWMLPVK